MDETSYHVRVPKRWVRIALIVATTALVVAPLSAIATHSFTDVPNDNTFHADIEWLKDADVTRGCNPPANTRYCPKDNVTREQMSAFMRRLAENRVVDAGTLEGREAGEFVAHGEIVTSVGGGTWIPNGFITPSEVTHAAGTTRVANGAVELELQGPAKLGGVDYGLQSFTYCIHSVQGGASVDGVEVFRGSSNILPPLVLDTTNRTVAGCYPVDVGHSGDTYSVVVHVSGSNLRVGGMEVTWLPASQLTASTSSTSDEASPATGS